MHRLLFATLCLFLSQAAAQADVTLAEWNFWQPGNPLGWTAVSGVSNFGVSGGTLWGVTSSDAATIMSPGGLTLPVAGDPANPNDNNQAYLQIRMRARFASGADDRFGSTLAYVSYTVDEWCCDEWDWGDGTRTPFRIWGNGEWKTYNVWMGNRWNWIPRFVTQMKLQVGSMPDALIEIASIKVMRDQTPPSFNIETDWSFRDNEPTPDTTPTLALQDFYDDVSSIERAEFYWRPGASTLESAWVLAGTDADASDGYGFTYPAFAPGTYDLGVKLYDRAGNAGSWVDSTNHWIDNLTISPYTQARIDVDANSLRGQVNKNILGNNVVWIDFDQLYSPVTRRLPDNLEKLLSDLGVRAMRYPGGNYADTFFWKETIGPLASRVDQVTMHCTGDTMVGFPRFGLDEFLQYCERRSIKPMLICRFRWAPGSYFHPNLDWPAAPSFEDKELPDPFQKALQDAVDLVEYCNAPNDGSNPNGGVDWAAVRAANGHHEPYDVRSFEIGGEPWGPDCLGSPSRFIASSGDAATAHALSYRVFRDAMKAVDPKIEVSLQTGLAAGYPLVDQGSWESCFDVLHQGGFDADLISHHPYLPWERNQTDLGALYTETMASARSLDDVLSKFRTFKRFTVPEREDDLKVRFGEWQLSYEYNPQNPLSTKHTSTLKAAIGTADMLRIMLEHSDTITEAGWWHLYGPTCWSTFFEDPYPVYHVLRMYSKHFGEQLVRSRVSGSPTFDYTNPPEQEGVNLMHSYGGISQLASIASRSNDGNTLYLVVINKDRSNPITTTVNLSNFLPGETKFHADKWVITGPDLEWNAPDPNDPSLFDPANVTLEQSITEVNRSFSEAFPPRSITSYKFISSMPVSLRIGEAKLRPGSLVTVGEKSEVVVSAIMGPDVMYVQEADKSAGIKVVGLTAASDEGDRVRITGTVQEPANAEAFIMADSVAKTQSGAAPEPLLADPRQWQSSAVEPAGLLVRTWGLVASQCPDSFYLNGMMNVECEYNSLGLKVYWPITQRIGEFVYVTGIRSIEDPGFGRLGAPVIRALTVEALDVPPVNIPHVTVGKDLQVPIQITLGEAPDTPKTVTITSSSPSTATVSKDPTQEGSGSVSFVGVSGTTVGTVYVQGRALGGANVTASTPGFADGISSVVVNPAGFCIQSPTQIDATSPSGNTTINIRAFRLDPGTLTKTAEQGIRGGLTVTLPVTSSNTSAGVITTSPLMFGPGESSKNTQFDPYGFGTTTITAQTPAGFTTPGAGQSSIQARVMPSISLSNATVGKDLQVPITVTLGRAPTAPVDVTVKCSSVSIVTLSKDAASAGASTVTFTGVTGTSVGTIYVQGRGLGNAVLTAMADGYYDGHQDATVWPSGFSIMSPASISTYSTGANVPVEVRAYRLDPGTHLRTSSQPVRGGLIVSVPIVSSNPVAGVVTVSPLVFNGNEAAKVTEFDPLAIGTTSVIVNAPPGFTKPGQEQDRISAQVLPLISLGSACVGKDLQVPITVSLEQTPTAPVDVAVVSNSPAVVTLSKDPVLEGTGSVTFAGVTTKTVGTVYVQGRSLGEVYLSASASGHYNGLSSASVWPSGFAWLAPTTMTTYRTAPNSDLSIRAFRLDCVTFAKTTEQALRGGKSVSISLTSSNPAVGILTPGSVFFGPNDSAKATQFDPSSAGLTTLQVVTPTGWSTSSTNTDIVVTVL